MKFSTLPLLSLFLPLITNTHVLASRKHVLVYTRTDGFRHDSIPTAIDVIKKLGKRHHFEVTSTEDPSKMDKQQWLDQFDTVMFVSASGQAMSDKGANNFRKYIEKGGGFIGVHEACDAMGKTPWYGRLVGGYFNFHPYAQKATFHIHNHDHPSVAHLGKTWRHFDEIYSYVGNPVLNGHKLVLSVDDSSFNNEGPSEAELRILQCPVHPIAWYKDGQKDHLLTYPKHKTLNRLLQNKLADVKKGIQGSGGAGRSFYTGLGHSNATWHEKDFQQHILGAIQWTLDSPSLRSNGAGENAPGSKAPVVKATPAAPKSPTNSTATKNGGKGSSAAHPVVNNIAQQANSDGDTYAIHHTGGAEGAASSSWLALSALSALTLTALVL